MDDACLVTGLMVCAPLIEDPALQKQNQSIMLNQISNIVKEFKMVQRNLICSSTVIATMHTVKNLVISHFRWDKQDPTFLCLFIIFIQILLNHNVSRHILSNATAAQAYLHPFIVTILRNFSYYLTTDGDSYETVGPFSNLDEFRAMIQTLIDEINTTQFESEIKKLGFNQDVAKNVVS